MSIDRHDVGARMSQIVIHNGVVYLSGQTSDAGVDTATQAQEVLAKIDRHLAAAGTDKSKLLSTQIWLRDIADFDTMNAVWEAWVPEGETPARATVEARLARSSLRVEIQVTAAL